MKDPELIPERQYPESMLIALLYAASSGFQSYRTFHWKVPDAIISSLYPCPLHVAYHIECQCLARLYYYSIAMSCNKNILTLIINHIFY